MLKRLIKKKIKQSIKELIDDFKKAPKEFTIEAGTNKDGKMTITGQYKIKF